MSWVSVAISDWQSMWRLLLLFALAVVTATLLVAGSTLSVAYLWPKNTSVQLDLTNGGALLVKSRGGVTAGSIAVHGSDYWVDTGVKVPAGGSITLASTGRVNLARHYISEHNRWNLRLMSEWVGPNGQETPRAGSDGFREMLIAPKEPPGILLGYLGERKPNISDPRPAGLAAIGARNSVTNDSSVEKTLFLVVNDGIVDFSNGELTQNALTYYMEMELTGEKDLEARYNAAYQALSEEHRTLVDELKDETRHWKLDEFRKHTRGFAEIGNYKDRRLIFYYHRWQYMKRNSYHLVYFDDNDGQYLVNYRVDPKGLRSEAR